MGLISRSLGFNALSLEDPSQPLLPYSALYESLGLGRSDAGVLVNEKQAMRLTTVYGCVKVISEDLSRVSLDIFQQLPNGAVRLANEHRAYPIIHDRPNPNMSAMVWRGVMLAGVCMNGNAYSWIKRDKAARVIALWPLAPDKTHPVYVEGKLMYATTQTGNGQATYIDPEDILHFMNMSLDGITGLSPINEHRNAVGLGLAAEKFGALLFGNGARATGVLSHPAHLDTEAYENLKKSVGEMATGDNALKPLILEEGMEWKQLSINPTDAQYLELRKFQKEEIAGLYRVPLHLLQDLQRATNNNIEHQGLDYVRFCLSPRAVNIEQEINYKILGKGYFCEHNFMDLQRGDFASQTTGLLALRTGGVYSANDVLRALRQNPISDDEGGNVRIVNSANISLEALNANPNGIAPTPGTPDTGDTDPTEGNPAAMQKEHILASYRLLIRDAVGRAINRNADQDFVGKAFQPIVASMCTTLLASRYGSAEPTEADVDRIGSTVKAIATQAAAWQKTDATEIATRITAEVYDALATGY